MRILTDQDVYASTVKLLRDAGHDVVTAVEIKMSQAADSDLLKTANDDRRIYVTRDRDYGGLVFVDALGSGVIYLRLQPSTLNAVHQELLHVLCLYSESDLMSNFIVVEPGRHRIRRPTQGTASSTQDPP